MDAAQQSWSSCKVCLKDPREGHCYTIKFCLVLERLKYAPITQKNVHAYDPINISNNHTELDLGQAETARENIIFSFSAFAINMHTMFTFTYSLRDWIKWKAIANEYQEYILVTYS